MEKNSKKKLKKDAADITKIYEIIKGKGFVHDLWLDVLSDLRKKPSYLQIKSMVHQVIETSVKNYATKPKDYDEKLKTRTTFTDLGIMTYTIDSLISDVLKKKLKGELISMISNVISEHNHKTNLENTDKTEAVIMLEDIGKLLCCNGNDKNHDKPYGSSDSPGPSKKRSEKIASSPSSAKKGAKPNSTRKETPLVKHSNLNMTCSNITNSHSKSPSRKLDFSSSSSKSDAISNNDNSDVDVTNVSDEEDENCSIKSVSSVHTSDLSSFEDDISVSSEDEEGAKVKKHVSLKLAKELYNSGRLSEIHQRTEEWVSPRQKKNISIDSSNQRSSARIRKPNSKYASEDVICPLNLSFTESVLSAKDEEDVLPTDSTEMQQLSSPIKRERTPSEEELKTDSNRKNESSDLNDSSLTLSPNVFKKVKQNAAKRGRPKKDKLLTEQNSSNNEQIRSETKAKRGRPSKGNHEEFVAKKKQCILDEILPNLEKKLQLQTQQNAQKLSQLNNKNDVSEIKRKRGRPSNNKPLKQLSEDEPIQHSVESFSILEERLCQSNKVNAHSSPSKSSKKYDTSDLYKPRSDFRIFNSNRESRAFTLFSN